MPEAETYLRDLDPQLLRMRGLLRRWCEINSGTFHAAGLAVQCDELEREFSGIADEVTRRPISPYRSINSRGELTEQPLGECLLVRRRVDAPRRVLLSIHMDTVYPPDSFFQAVREFDENTWIGPGVADAKGGLVVMLFALETLEKFVADTGHRDLGWDVLINSDEEIGSPGSRVLFEELAPRVQRGLLFEPSLPGGMLVSSRKGTGNFSVLVRGRSAHSGRDFDAGRNAIVAAAAIALQLSSLTGRWPGVTFNVARIDGGGALNMVPDVAIVRCNIRYEQPEHAAEIESSLRSLIHSSPGDGITAELHGDFSSPAKPLTPELEVMLEEFRTCGRELGLDLRWQPSGGACDGNRLAALGVPCVDSLGVRGGKIHSPDEFVLLDSLTERAKLTALYLIRLALHAISP